MPTTISFVRMAERQLFRRQSPLAMVKFSAVQVNSADERNAHDLGSRMARESRNLSSKGAPSRRALRKESIDRRIVTAALRQIISSGAIRLALADVADVAAVSRTTLYKYYRTRDDLLSAVSRRVRAIYKTELRAAIQGHDEPRDRLSAVLKFMSDFHENWKAEQMINLQLEQIVGDIRRDFSYYRTLLNEALSPVFASLERRGLRSKGRKLLVEILIRTQLSNAIIPLGEDWSALPKLALSAWDALMEIPLSPGAKAITTFK